MNKGTLIVYMCEPNGAHIRHVMPTYIYHDGMVPIVIACPVCGVKMKIIDDNIAYDTNQSLLSAIARKPCKEEYESYNRRKQNAIKAGLLTIQPFMSSSSLFRSIRIDELNEFRNWALVNHTPGDKVRYGIHHPIVTYECQRMNDEAIGWSV